MSQPTSNLHETTPQVQRAVARWSIRAAVGTLIYGVLIFLPAGTLSWVWGWAFLAVLDVSDPTRLQLKEFISFAAGGIADVAAEGDSLYVAARVCEDRMQCASEGPRFYSSLFIFDLADPAAPALVSQWRLSDPLNP